MRLSFQGYFLRMFFFFLSFIFIIKQGYTEKIDFPEVFGKVNESYEGHSQRTVIIIQDTHRNDECQVNAVQILNSISTRESIPLIALEGAKGPFLTSMIRNLPDKNLNQEVATYFLREGRITAPEYFAMVSEWALHTELLGVEDRDLYLKDLDLFKKAHEEAKGLENALSTLDKMLIQLKAEVYSGELKDWDVLVDEYQKGRIPFKAYFRKLFQGAQESPQILQDYPEGVSQGEIFKLEEKIQFFVLDQERSKMITALSQRLSSKMLSKLLVRSLDYRMRRMSSYLYHRLLWRLARGVGLKPEDYPNLDLYETYIERIHGLSEKKLFKELSALTEFFQKKSVQSEGQRELVDISRRLSLIEKMMQLRISNEDFEDFLSHEDTYRWEKMVRPLEDLAHSLEIHFVLPEELKQLDQTLPLFRSFYEAALQRNQAMVRNLLERMDILNDRFAVLFIGGFHIQGVSALLKEKGVSYFVITPRVTTLQTGESLYFPLLLNEKNIFEKWSTPISFLPSALEAPHVLNDPPLAYPDQQVAVLRLYALFFEGVKLLDHLSEEKLNGVPWLEKDRVWGSLEKIVEKAGGDTFKMCFSSSVLKEGVLEVPVYFRNEEREESAASVLFREGPFAEVKMDDRVMTQEGSSLLALETLHFSQRDIQVCVVERNSAEMKIHREWRDRVLREKLQDLGFSKRFSQDLAFQLTHAWRSSGENLERLKKNFREEFKDKNLDGKRALEILEAFHQAAVSPFDFLTLEDWAKAFLEAGLYENGAEGKQFEEMKAMASLERRSWNEFQDFGDDFLNQELLMKKPVVMGVEWESLFDVQEKDPNTFEVRWMAPELGQILKCFWAYSGERGQRGKGLKFVFFSFQPTVDKALMRQVLISAGIPEEGLQGCLIDRSDLQRVENPNQTLYRLIQDQTGISPERVALICLEESPLKFKKVNQVVARLQRPGLATGKRVDFCDALATAMVLLNESIDKKGDGILNSFVQVLAKRLGKTEEEASRVLRSVMAAKGYTFSAEDDLTGASEMERIGVQKENPAREKEKG